MTLPQIGPAALVYVNELFIQSHESFVRFYPSHFTDTGVMGGPPRGPAMAAGSGPSVSSSSSPSSTISESPGSAVCNLTGQWSMPIGHGTLVQDGTLITGQCCVTPASPHDKEFVCKGNFTGLPPGPPPPLPPPPPPIPAVPGQPQCGSFTPPPPTPPLGPTNIELEFEKASDATTTLVGVVANDCNSIHWLPATSSNKPYTRGWKSTPDVSSPSDGAYDVHQQEQHDVSESHDEDKSEGDPYHGPSQHTLRPWLGSSFKSLRAHGAFLLSGSLSETGEIGDIKIFAEKAANFTFLTPWPAQHDLPVVRTDAGAKVEVVAVVPPSSEVYLEAGERLFRFATHVNASYTLSPGKR